MISNRFVVLAAAVELESFTVADLASACDLDPSSVRTVIERNSELFERLGKAEPKGRGGRAIVFRIAPVRVDDVRSLLSATLVGFDQGLPQRRSSSVSPEILSAHDVLTRRLPAANLQLHETMLLGAKSLVAAMNENSYSSGLDAVYRRADELLIELSSGELDPPSNENWMANLCLRFVEIEQAAKSAGALTLISDLYQRFLLSPLSRLYVDHIGDALRRQESKSLDVETVHAADSDDFSSNLTSRFPHAAAYFDQSELLDITYGVQSADSTYFSRV